MIVRTDGQARGEENISFFFTVCVFMFMIPPSVFISMIPPSNYI